LQLNITIEDLFNMPTAVIYNPDNYKSAAAVSIDSRNVKKNSIFVAITGEKFDGHKFAVSAINNGAESIVINRNQLKNFLSIDVPIITVKDTTEALSFLANVWRRKLSTQVISITGSSGKTSVKEMLSKLLAEKYSVCKTEANNNNHIGVPLTILSAKKNDEILLLEHGTNHFGEIGYTTKIAEPNFALITNIGNSHLEYLKTKSGVFKEKKSLFDITSNNHGQLFINSDDKILSRQIGKYPNAITFGFNQTSDVCGKILSYDKYGYPKVQIKSNSKSIETIIPLLGESSAKNFLAAVAIGINLSLSKKNILDAVKKFKPYDKRLNVTRYKNHTIVDDSYNSNPDSLKSSIEAVIHITEGEKRILILGDMFELGAKSIELHEGISRIISKKNIDTVYTIGENIKRLNTKLEKKNVSNRHFGTRKNLAVFLQKLDLQNSVVLIKGSRGMKMEEFVKILIGKN
jgi:UDP-N-acetylmuramoyl-tripeptide--D-alanyl-D-alanine ligase